ncbi:MAG: hypothetical protein ACP5NC_07960 [Nitrososphaeria archaeon]
MHVGMDLGIKTQITLSNGVRVEYQIQPSEKLKELQRKLSRKKIGSRRYRIAKLKTMSSRYKNTWHASQECSNYHMRNKISPSM